MSKGFCNHNLRVQVDFGRFICRNMFLYLHSGFLFILIIIVQLKKKPHSNTKISAQDGNNI